MDCVDTAVRTEAGCCCWLLMLIAAAGWLLLIAAAGSCCWVLLLVECCWLLLLVAAVDCRCWLLLLAGILWIFPGYSWWFGTKTTLQAKKSLNILEEAMKKFGKDKFWNWSKIRAGITLWKMMRGKWNSILPREIRPVDGRKMKMNKVRE